MKTGAFIALEGIDGSGKSTHIKTITDRLAANNIPYITTREVGGTKVGEELRTILLREPMDLTTEVGIAFSARNEHLQSLIRPALAAGTWVICDRFVASTFAFQGGGRGADHSLLLALSGSIVRDTHPNLSLLFDIDPNIAHARMGGRELDRFEQEKLSFHCAVRDAYFAYYRDVAPDREQRRVCVMDSAQPLAAVTLAVEHVVEQFIREWVSS